MFKKIGAFFAGAAFVAGGIFVGLLFLDSQEPTVASVEAPPPDFSEETKECVACHKEKSRSIVQQWGDSKHYRAKVGCYECHKAIRMIRMLLFMMEGRSKNIFPSLFRQKTVQTATKRRLINIKPLTIPKAGVLLAH
jgi:hypothetical protein